MAEGYLATSKEEGARMIKPPPLLHMVPPPSLALSYARLGIHLLILIYPLFFLYTLSYMHFN